MNKKLERLIWIFSIIKLLIHWFTNTRYGLHRDEYLYLADGHHLAWGYMEVPPLTPLLGWVVHILGGSVFTVRLFPALIGACTIFLAGKLIKSLGGKFWAISLGCLGLIFSPALCWSNTLFQPVSFNQFFWFLTAWSIVKFIQTDRREFGIILGLSMGLGMLNKYSILFYFVALLIGFLLTPQRRLLIRKEILFGFFISVILILPNIFWQVRHNFPVLQHMEELKNNQLHLISITDYFMPMLFFFLPAIFLWVAGMYALLVKSQFKPYRGIGIAFLVVITMIGLLNGKAYYTIGAFSILFVFGSIYLEKIFRLKGKVISLAFIILLFIPILPLSLPILSLPVLEKYCQLLCDSGLSAPMRWEDGKINPIPQDVADMHGWEELAQKASNLYHSLPKENQSTCMIYGASYGHAASLSYYSEKYNLPEIYSLNAGFMIWGTDNIYFDNQIFIDEVCLDSSSWFNQFVLVDSIQNPVARDPGYIYYRTDPKREVSVHWNKLVGDMRREFNF